jgi:lipoate-protein ligase A
MPVEAAPLTLDVYGQMALDEAILDSVEPPALTLRFYSWAGPAATFGMTQREADARSILISRGLETLSLVRRPTGGGVVVHDGDLTFSLIFPWEQLSAPSLIYKNIHRGIHLGLKAVKVESRLWGGPVDALRPQASCFAGPEPMDLVDANGRKVLGGALRRKRTSGDAGMGLYQGSLRPEVLGAPVELIKEAISYAVELEWERPASQEISASWILAGEILRGKYESQEWNSRR